MIPDTVKTGEECETFFVWQKSNDPNLYKAKLILDCN